MKKCTDIPSDIISYFIFDMKYVRYLYRPDMKEMLLSWFNFAY